MIVCAVASQKRLRLKWVKQQFKINFCCPVKKKTKQKNNTDYLQGNKEFLYLKNYFTGKTSRASCQDWFLKVSNLEDPGRQNLFLEDCHWWTAEQRAEILKHNVDCLFPAVCHVT